MGGGGVGVGVGVHISTMCVFVCAWNRCRPAVVRDTLRGAIATQLIQPDSEIVSIYHRRYEGTADGCIAPG